MLIAAATFKHCARTATPVSKSARTATKTRMISLYTRVHNGVKQKPLQSALKSLRRPVQQVLDLHLKIPIAAQHRLAQLGDLRSPSALPPTAVFTSGRCHLRFIASTSIHARR